VALSYRDDGYGWAETGLSPVRIEGSSPGSLLVLLFSTFQHALAPDWEIHSPGRRHDFRQCCSLLAFGPEAWVASRPGKVGRTRVMLDRDHIAQRHLCKMNGIASSRNKQGQMKRNKPPIRFAVSRNLLTSITISRRRSQFIPVAVESACGRVMPAGETRGGGIQQSATSSLSRPSQGSSVASELVECKTCRREGGADCIYTPLAVSTLPLVSARRGRPTSARGPAAAGPSSAGPGPRNRRPSAPCRASGLLSSPGARRKKATGAAVSGPMTNSIAAPISACVRRGFAATGRQGYVAAPSAARTSPAPKPPLDTIQFLSL
jgi:hypothetical protein